MTEEQGYPLNIRGDFPDADISRWLWLVKWFLAIPHIFALIFLGIAMFVVWIIAFWAVLITARYPRGLFDFTVGVMRWGWRVGFYAFGPLATDRYPPFSLRSNDDYPADLYVEYPERLSRAKVLFKWWLLAIPHYLALGALVGTGGALFQNSIGTLTIGTEVLEFGSETADIGAIVLGERLISIGISGIVPAVISTGGLAGMIVIITMITLLFRGRYPSDNFNLLMGISRWSNRVMGYALLLYDKYPPFRFKP